MSLLPHTILVDPFPNTITYPKSNAEPNSSTANEETNKRTNGRAITISAPDSSTHNSKANSRAYDGISD